MKQKIVYMVEKRPGSLIRPLRNCQISLSSLAELTGFPAEFIKKELLLKDPTSLEELRLSMAKYLDRTVAIIKH